MSADLASAIADVVASGNVGDVAVQDFRRQAMVICGSVSSGEAQGGGDGEVAAGGGGCSCCGEPGDDSQGYQKDEKAGGTSCGIDQFLR